MNDYIGKANQRALQDDTQITEEEWERVDAIREAIKTFGRDYQHITHSDTDFLLSIIDRLKNQKQSEQ